VSPAIWTGTKRGAAAAGCAPSAASFRHQYQKLHGEIWCRRAKLARDSPLLRHCATKRAIRAAARVSAIGNPPAQRIRQQPVQLKTGFVERLRANIVSLASTVRGHDRNKCGDLPKITHNPHNLWCDTRKGGSTWHWPKGTRRRGIAVRGCRK